MTISPLKRVLFIAGTLTWRRSCRASCACCSSCNDNGLHGCLLTLCSNQDKQEFFILNVAIKKRKIENKEDDRHGH